MTKLNWNFMFSMTQMIGFPKKLMSWIKVCVSTASLYKVVNGSPTEKFKMQKGWQGDPLSPFLFVIAVEGLNWLSQKAK